MKRKKSRPQEPKAPPPPPTAAAPPRGPKKLSPEALAKLHASATSLELAATRHQLAATQHALLVRTLERDYEFIYANVQIQPDGTIMDMSKFNRPKPTPPEAFENIRKQGHPPPAKEAEPADPEKEKNGAAAPAPGLELDGG